jgi:predicted PurR-regulated permease PerM
MSASLARRISTAIVLLALISAALWIALRIPHTLSMFLIAALIAFGASPLVRALERRMPRTAAIALVYLGLIGALVLLVLVVVPISYGQILALVSHTGEYVQASQQLVADVERFLHDRLGNRVALPTFSQVQGEVGSRVGMLFAVTLESIGTILFTTANVLLIGLSALILSVFLLARGREIRSGVLSLMPPSRREETSALMVEVASIFGHFVAGQLALCAIVGFAVWLALAPAHFAFALLVAVISALGYAVPFIGMIVAQVIAAVLAIPQGSGMVLYVSVAIFLIARVADNLLVPKVMGDSVGVSPIGVMFAVFAGGELFGLWGLVLGIPAAALVRVMFTYFVLPWIHRAQGVEPAAAHDPVPEIVPPIHEVSYADAS